MIPLVRKNLALLAESDHSFKAIYDIFSSFHDEIFAEQIKNGRVVKTTYAEVCALVEECSEKVSARAKKCPGGSGIVGIYMDNCVEWVALFYGILRAGYTPILLNTRQDMAVTNELIADVKPLFTVSQSSGVSGSVSYDELMAEPAQALSEPAWRNRILLVTSGSTKKPKVVAQTGNNICSQIELSAEILKKNSTLKHNRKLEVRQLAFLPFYHIFGLVAVLMWFSFFGRTFIFMSDYGVNTIQSTCQRLDVSHFFAIPLVWESVVKKLLAEVNSQGKTKIFNKMIDFSNSLQTVFPHAGPHIVRGIIFKNVRKQLLGTNLNFLISGGGFISPEALRVLNGLGCSLYLGYGLTECGILSVNITRKAGRRLTQSCGGIFSNVEYKVSEEGELLIGRKNCFEGMYINSSFVPFADDFYHTNDIVRFDGDEMYIIGRSDDVIILENGENLSPESIESRIDIGGALYGAMLVTDEGGKKQLMFAFEPDVRESAYDRALTLKRIYSSIESLPMSERPAKVAVLIGPVPHNFKGIDRKRLSEMLKNGEVYADECSPVAEGAAERLLGEEYKNVLSQVKECFAQVTGKSADEIGDSTDFVYLGGDSMTYVELLSVVAAKTGADMSFTERPLMNPAAFADYIIRQKEENAD